MTPEPFSNSLYFLLLCLMILKQLSFDSEALSGRYLGAPTYIGIEKHLELGKRHHLVANSIMDQLNMLVLLLNQLSCFRRHLCCYLINLLRISLSSYFDLELSLPLGEHGSSLESLECPQKT
jgi:hypothetical protein